MSPSVSYAVLPCASRRGSVAAVHEAGPAEPPKPLDINITIDVMRHAYTDAVDVVYLLSGDGDFVELVSEVARSGKKVCLGALSSGLEPRLRYAVDRFILLDDLFFHPVQEAAPSPREAADAS